VTGLKVSAKSKFSNKMAKRVDLSESSLLEAMEQLRSMMEDRGTLVVKPTRAVVPPWVVEEIERDYGAPATEAKYHLWNAKRLGLSADDYALRLFELV